MNASVAPYIRWDALAHAFGAPVLHAGFKQRPEDFQVDELLGFEPDGDGEHLLLQVEKVGLTTFDAQSLLARHFDVAVRDTAFAGMKDKQGVTRQWFSVPVRNDKSLPDTLQHQHLKVLQSARNGRKLRRGAHRGNSFRIVLRNARGSESAALERIRELSTRGVPNYFGVQRFGHDEANVPEALAWFRGEASPSRTQRSMLLSAARSYLFNAQLSRRVQEGSWDSWIDGDLMALAGSASTFSSTKATPEELRGRLLEMDIHATGPLWGKGELAVTGAALLQESRLAEQFPSLCAGLAAHGLEQERRPLRAQVGNLQAHFESGNLVLEFSLGRGVYATSVLRELVYLETA